MLEVKLPLCQLIQEVAVESNSITGTFHNDSADQIFVATARIFDMTIL